MVFFWWIKGNCKLMFLSNVVVSLFYLVFQFFSFTLSISVIFFTTKLLTVHFYMQRSAMPLQRKESCFQWLCKKHLTTKRRISMTSCLWSLSQPVFWSHLQQNFINYHTYFYTILKRLFINVSWWMQMLQYITTLHYTAGLH